MQKNFDNIHDMVKAMNNDVIAHTNSIVTDSAKMMAEQLRERSKIPAEIEYPSSGSNPSRVVTHQSDENSTEKEAQSVKEAQDWAVELMSDDGGVAWMLRRIGVY